MAQDFTVAKGGWNYLFQSCICIGIATTLLSGLYYLLGNFAPKLGLDSVLGALHQSIAWQEVITKRVCHAHDQSRWLASLCIFHVYLITPPQKFLWF